MTLACHPIHTSHFSRFPFHIAEIQENYGHIPPLENSLPKHK